MSLIDRKLAKDTNVPSNDTISRQAAIDTEETKTSVVRKQVLVIKCNLIMSNEKMEDIRRKFINQMKEGTLLLPSGFDALTVDTDYIVIANTRGGGEEHG